MNSLVDIKVKSKDSKFKYYESELRDGQNLFQICSEDSSGSLIVITGCAELVSFKAIMYLAIGTITYSFFILAGFLLVRKKFDKHIFRIQKYLVSALGDKNGTEDFIAIKEIEDIRLSLQKKSLELSEYSKNEALNLISKKIVHDLKSPLAVLSDYFKETSSSSTSSLVLESISSISLMSRELLSNGENGLKLPMQRRIYLSKMIQDLLDSKKIEYHSDRITLKMLEDCQLYLNQLDLKRALSNLLNNALESAPNAIVSIELKKNDGYYQIDIQDSGPGFPPELLMNFLNRKSFSNKKDGHGIGLLSALDYFRSVGGDLSIKNTSIGALVTCYLPPDLNFADIPMILIDNDKYVRLSWSIRAEKLSIKFFSFDSFTSFEKQAADYPRECEIFIDSDFGKDELPGEAYLSRLAELGFININFATGKSLEELKSVDCSRINSIVGKSFPYE